MTTLNGASVSMSFHQWLALMGKLYSVSHEFTSVGEVAGCKMLLVVPEGSTLHYSASYWSKFGGILHAYYGPTVDAVGTEITPLNYKTALANTLKSKFYYTPTASGGVIVRPIGIPGGTAVAGNGTSGNAEERSELELKPGNYLITINPFADAATIIVNADVWEDWV